MASKKKNEPREKKDLKEIIESYNKQHGRDAIFSLGQKKSVQVRAIPSGDVMLDDTLGCGGWPRGRIVELFGRNSSCKTTLVGMAIAQVQEAGGKAFYIDAEHKIDPAYFAALGVDIDALLTRQPESAEDALKLAEDLIWSGELDIVALDSIAMMTPESELEDDDMVARDGAGMERAQLLSKHFRRVKSKVNNGRTCYMCVNQIRDTMGQGEVQPGGNGLKFAAALRVRCGQWWDNGKWVGMTVQPVKNQVGGKVYVRAELPFAEEHNTGLDLHGSLVRLAPDMGIIEKAGAHYYINYRGEREKMGHGWANAARWLDGNPEATKWLLAQIDAVQGFNR